MSLLGAVEGSRFFLHDDKPTQVTASEKGWDHFLKSARNAWNKIEPNCENIQDDNSPNAM